MSEQRSEGIPGMGLLYGAPGYGKTSATIWLINLVKFQRQKTANLLTCRLSRIAMATRKLHCAVRLWYSSSFNKFRQTNIAR